MPMNKIEAYLIIDAEGNLIGTLDYKYPLNDQIAKAARAIPGVTVRTAYSVIDGDVLKNEKRAATV